MAAERSQERPLREEPDRSAAPAARRPSVYAAQAMKRPIFVVRPQLTSYERR